MSETKFTPGPWIKRGKGTIETNGGAEVASVMDGQMLDRVDRETQEANAHLIAAAPELYEALRGCAEALVYYGTMKPSGEFQKAIPRLGDALSEAKAVLAKARGEA